MGRSKEPIQRGRDRHKVLIPGETAFPGNLIKTISCFQVKVMTIGVGRPFSPGHVPRCGSAVPGYAWGTDFLINLFIYTFNFFLFKSDSSGNLQNACLHFFFLK